MRRVDSLEKTLMLGGIGGRRRRGRQDEMAGWHHWLDGRESEWTPGVGEGQGGLVCCDSWGHKESDTTEGLIWSDLIWSEEDPSGSIHSHRVDPPRWLSAYVASLALYEGSGTHTYWDTGGTKEGCLLSFILAKVSAQRRAPSSVRACQGYRVFAHELQSCSTLCDPIDCSPPGSSVHGILQARILEWVAMPSSRGFSLPRGLTHVPYVSCIGRQVLYH